MKIELETVVTYVFLLAFLAMFWSTVIVWLT